MYNMAHMVIYTGRTQKKEQYCVRHLEEKDAEMLMHYINELSLERTFILRQGEQISYDEEKKFVESQLTKIKERKPTF